MADATTFFYIFFIFLLLLLSAVLVVWHKRANGICQNSTFYAFSCLCLELFAELVMLSPLGTLTRVTAEFSDRGGRPVVGRFGMSAIPVT